MSLPKYKNPVTKLEDIKALQEKLVQCCIDFIKERNLTDIDEVLFNVDGLERYAIEYGKWVPQMDSHISVYGIQETGSTYTDRKGNEKQIYGRAFIGEYF